MYSTNFNFGVENIPPPPSSQDSLRGSSPIQGEAFYRSNTAGDPPFKGAYKTELCRYVLADTKCRFGAQRCKWAHSIEEMHQHRRAILNQARRHFEGGKMYQPRIEPAGQSVGQLPLSIWDELQSCSASSTPATTNLEERNIGNECGVPVVIEDTQMANLQSAQSEDILEILAVLQADLGNLTEKNEDNFVAREYDEPDVGCYNVNNKNNTEEGCSIQ